MKDQEDYVIDGKWIYGLKCNGKQFYLKNLLFIEANYTGYCNSIYVKLYFSCQDCLVIKKIEYNNTFEDKQNAYKKALNYIEQFKEKIKDII